MKLNKNLGFLGAGNMGAALISGILASELCSREEIFAVDTNPERRKYIKDAYEIETSDNVIGVISNSDVIILAVKPQMIEALLREIVSLVGSKLIISIAAGVSLGFIEKLLLQNARVVRVMPNTPAQVGQGVSVYAPGRNATPEDAEITEQIFSAVGACYKTDEKALNAVTGLSGSGPAYVFEFLQGLIDAGVYVGLPRELATNLASQTIKGSMEMFLQNNLHPRELRDLVTSPGGTTVEGLAVLNKGGFSALLTEAVKAAAGKSEKLER